MNAPYMGRFRVSQPYRGNVHDGLDLVGVDSKCIHATVNGVVVFAGYENPQNPAQGFGLYVKIRRTGTREVYYFGHLSAAYVKTGDTVRITDQIGREGSTGRSTGSHCHYCMRLDGVKGQHRDISQIAGIPNVCGLYDDGYVTRLTQINAQARAAAALTVGDAVKVRADARDYTGKKLAAFVFRTTFSVLSLSGDRVVIGLNHRVTAAVHRDDLLLA